MKSGLVTEADNNYSSEQSKQIDLAWNAFQRGYINKESEPGLDIWSEVRLPLKDEYRFVRKNFNPIWSVYILVIRTVTFHNPLKEIVAFWHTRNVKRIYHAANHVEHASYTDFTSSLLTAKPLVSIVIPTLNRYPWLIDVFKDLEKQTYRNFEVIVVDQSTPFQESVYQNWNFSLRYWYQEEKALWKARNDAIISAKGDYILLYDDDSRVGMDWIEHHLKSLDYFNADISSGVSISSIGAKVPAHYTYFRWSDQLDTGNVLVKRQVFEKIGLFDLQFEKMRMGDGEYGLRAYLAGFKNISNPYSKRVHLKVSDGGLRQMGSWDGFRPTNWLAPRPIPSVLYLVRKYYGNIMAIYDLLIKVPASLVPLKYKKMPFLLLLVSMLSIVMFPLVLIQILRSWFISTKMIDVGSKIDKLKASQLI